jgi:hypothetical protein
MVNNREVIWGGIGARNARRDRPQSGRTRRDLQTINMMRGNVLLLKEHNFGPILDRSPWLSQQSEEAIMAIQIVMDRTGDSRHHFNSHDTQELAKAEQRFYELTKVGFTAAVRTGPGQVSQIRSFDPKADETVFFPRLVGG